MRALLAPVKANAQFHVGFIPETFRDVSIPQLAFAHIDVDLYQSVLDCVEFVYPRLTPGGVMLFDDYGFPSCTRAREATDLAFAHRRRSRSIFRPGRLSCSNFPEALMNHCAAKPDDWEEHWDRYALRRQPQSPPTEMRHRLIAQLLQGKATSSESRVLDLGSGQGDLFVKLRTVLPDARLVGFELSERGVEVSRKKGAWGDLPCGRLVSAAGGPGPIQKLGDRCGVLGSPGTRRFSRGVHRRRAVLSHGWGAAHCHRSGRADVGLRQAYRAPAALHPAQHRAGPGEGRISGGSNLSRWFSLL
ncbi:MAG: TylF/MycF/NovP-related O-methyltransferase [Chthoniobacter sp.]